MSFDFNNSINNNLSNIQASAKSCPGGGGNTGYFKRGNKDDEKILEFAKDIPEDSFEHIDLCDIEEKEEENGFFNILKCFFINLIKKIKKIF